MKKTSEYHRHARECRALAAGMDSPEHRAQLLAMAEHWDQLAEDRATLVERHPEIGVDAGPETESPAEES